MAEEEDTYVRAAFPRRGDEAEGEEEEHDGDGADSTDRHAPRQERDNGDIPAFPHDAG